MKGSERYVSFYEMKLRCSSKVVMPEFDINSIFDVFDAAILSGGAHKSLKLSDAMHTVRFLEFQRNYSPEFAVGFLIIDEKDAATPARRKVDDFSFSLAPKAAGTEDEIGAHFFLRKTPDDDGRYPFFLERVEKLGYTTVRSLFRQIIHDAHESEKEAGKLGLFSGPHVSGKNAQVGYKPVVDLLGVPSEHFPSIMNNGLASNIVLYTEKKKDVFGNAPFLEERRQSMTVRINREAAKQDASAWQKVLAALKSRSEHWKTARISFETPDGERGAAVVDTSTGSFFDDKFVRKIRVSGIDPPLATSATGIVQHFANQTLSHHDVQ